MTSQNYKLKYLEQLVRIRTCGLILGDAEPYCVLCYLAIRQSVQPAMRSFALAHVHALACAKQRWFMVKHYGDPLVYPRSRGYATCHYCSGYRRSNASPQHVLNSVLCRFYQRLLHV